MLKIGFWSSVIVTSVFWHYWFSGQVRIWRWRDKMGGHVLVITMRTVSASFPLFIYSHRLSAHSTGYEILLHYKHSITIQGPPFSFKYGRFSLSSHYMTVGCPYSLVRSLLMYNLRPSSEKKEIGGISPSSLRVREGCSGEVFRWDDNGNSSIVLGFVNSVRMFCILFKKKNCGLFLTRKLRKKKMLWENLPMISCTQRRSNWLGFPSWTVSILCCSSFSAQVSSSDGIRYSSRGWGNYDWEVQRRQCGDQASGYTVWLYRDRTFLRLGWRRDWKRGWGNGRDVMVDIVWPVRSEQSTADS